MKKIFVLFVLILAAAGCGDPEVNLTEVEYQPKIVVEGFIYGGEPVSGVKIMRNFSIGEAIDSSSLFLTPEDNNVTAKINGVNLEYDPTVKKWRSDALTGEYGTSYLLEVEAKVDGKILKTTSRTVVPEEGFEILTKELGPIKYRTEPIVYSFTPSPGAEVYALSIRPDNPTLDNFIYDNMYFPDPDRKDLEDGFNNYKFQVDIMINVESTPGKILYDSVNKLDTWFYDDYKVIIYAGDKNFKDYLKTADFVQEMDGNFIAPRFHLDGDGIGIFGSAVRDTLSFSIVK